MYLLLSLLSIQLLSDKTRFAVEGILGDPRGGFAFGDIEVKAPFFPDDWGGTERRGIDSSRTYICVVLNMDCMDVCCELGGCCQHAEHFGSGNAKAQRAHKLILWYLSRKISLPSINRPAGPMARRLTTICCNQEIAGSIPASVNSFCIPTLFVSKNNLFLRQVHFAFVVFRAKTEDGVFGPLSAESSCLLKNLDLSSNMRQT